MALLRHALRNLGRSYTFASHQKSHNVSYQTARTDLMKLADLGLLDAGKVGRQFVYDVPLDLKDRISRLRDRRAR